MAVVSCRKAQALGTQPSVAAAQAQNLLVHGLVSRGMWDLPVSGIEPLSPTLAGEFFTTELPGKPIVMLRRQKIRVRYFVDFVHPVARCILR